MIKSIDFFLEKASEYKGAIDSILSNYINKEEIGWDPNPAYVQQQSNISELKLKTKLLFSEFDKGEFFLEEIKKVEGTPLLLRRGVEVLSKYHSLLNMFIDHIETYRK